ncbi:MAG: BrnA antitoxin family protein [Chloroflexota bacterium]|nr:BrnA antitoxin family protein [Chloroflexota bacterium]MDE2942221.1 BrnA antitoxin family protein [Chloroflexota bacterium]MDE3267688.1 BrnA antitoxin family protein [Chloroflexota bacterium]
MLKLSVEEIAASRMTFEEIAAEFGEETAIQVGVIRDQDTLELGQDWFQRARPATEVVPQVVERWRRTRGKQKAPTKEAISIRLDQDVLAYYRASGRGWQSRINEALRKYIVNADPEDTEEPGSEQQ